MSYGQIAAYVGTPRAARQVGWALHVLGDISNLPWWRVVNNAGRITIKESWHASPQMQQQLLEKEGVVFTSELQCNIEQYRYRADGATLARFKLDPAYIKTVLAKYDIA